MSTVREKLKTASGLGEGVPLRQHLANISAGTVQVNVIDEIAVSVEYDEISIQLEELEYDVRIECNDGD